MSYIDSAWPSPDGGCFIRSPRSNPGPSIRDRFCTFGLRWMPDRLALRIGGWLVGFAFSSQCCGSDGQMVRGQAKTWGRIGAAHDDGDRVPARPHPVESARLILNSRHGVSVVRKPSPDFRRGAECSPRKTSGRPGEQQSHRALSLPRSSGNRPLRFGPMHSDAAQISTRLDSFSCTAGEPNLDP